MNAADAATPEFIRWSIAVECDLRAGAGDGGPEFAERQLKGLRAYAEAVAAGRLCDEVCFEAALDAPPGPNHAPRGFRVIDVLRAYGATAPATWPCGSCPAHVDPPDHAPALAGCYGLVDWRPLGPSLPQRLSDELSDSAECDLLRREFLVTQPVWYGLWSESPLRAEQLALLEPLVGRWRTRGDAWNAVFDRFWRALVAARDSGLPLHVDYGPAGQLSGRHWTVVPHCGRCKVGRPLNSSVCSCCGLAERELPARRRLRRGERPYRQLAEFLPPLAREELLRRYLGTRGWAEPEIDAWLRRTTEQTASSNAQAPPA